MNSHKPSKCFTITFFGSIGGEVFPCLPSLGYFFLLQIKHLNTLRNEKQKKMCMHEKKINLNINNEI